MASICRPVTEDNATVCASDVHNDCPNGDIIVCRLAVCKHVWPATVLRLVMKEDVGRVALLRHVDSFQSGPVEPTLNHHRVPRHLKPQLPQRVF